MSRSDKTPSALADTRVAGVDASVAGAGVRSQATSSAMPDSAETQRRTLVRMARTPTTAGANGKTSKPSADGQCRALAPLVALPEGPIGSGMAAAQGALGLDGSRGGCAMKAL